MKRFCCGDVVPGCTAVFQFPNEQAILEAVALHSLHEYGLRDIPPALLEQAHSYIKSVPAA